MYTSEIKSGFHDIRIDGKFIGNYHTESKTFLFSGSRVTLTINQIEKLAEYLKTIK